MAYVSSKWWTTQDFRFQMFQKPKTKKKFLKTSQRERAREREKKKTGSCSYLQERVLESCFLFGSFSFMLSSSQVRSSFGNGGVAAISLCFI